MGDIANVRVWGTAKVFVAPVGTIAPTDTTSSWSGDWEELGLMGEDGFAIAKKQDSNDVYAYGQLYVRNVRSKYKETIKIVCLEDNAVVFGLVNPGSVVTTDAGITTRQRAVPIPDPRAFGLEFRDGDVVKRTIIETGEVTEVGDQTIADSDATMFELTISIYPDADGLLAVEITDDPGAEVIGS